MVDLDGALAAGAPPVHARGGRQRPGRGPARDQGFRRSGRRRRARWSRSRSARGARTRCRSRRAAATPPSTARTGRVTLTASMQMPHMLRTGIADLPRHPRGRPAGRRARRRRRLRPEDVARSRNMSSSSGRRAGSARSVAWIEDRRENLTASFHSRDQRHKVRGAFDAEGRLLALEADIALQCRRLLLLPGDLRGRAADGDGRAARALRHPRVQGARRAASTTNTCPMAPYRGVSRPVITLAMERLMDCAAGPARHRPGRNPPPQPRSRLPVQDRRPGWSIDEGCYRACLERRGATTIDLAGFRAPPARGARRRPLSRHRLLACSTSAPATARRLSPRARMDITPGYERVEIAMDPSGFVEAPDRRLAARPGAGHGARPADRRRARRRRPAQVRVIHGDTDRTPYGWGTFASRSMVISGGACKLAAGEARRQAARAIAATLLQAEPGKVVLADGAARGRAAPTSAIEHRARWRATAYHQSHRFGDDADRGLMAVATYDPRGHLLQRLPCRDRRGRCRDRRGRASSASSRSRTPAC